ncbi:MAG: DUF4230 domain-containing protein [Nitrospinota bacterium]|nr:DUF4230 domain-containing protein [Nitrospinota bacterium]
MGLELIKVETAAQKNAFLKLPWEIYRNEPRWIPPLLQERKRFLSPKINPFFKHAEVIHYLAIGENRKPAGRITFILDHAYSKFHSEKTGLFGLFESIDNQQVADLLLDAVYQECAARGLSKIMGPMNLSTNHECGLLVEGFEFPSMLGMPYNPQYYSNLLGKWGLVKAKDLLSFHIRNFKKIPEYLETTMVKIRKRNRFSVRCLKMKQFDKEMDLIWEVYNAAWIRNWGFVPMTVEEFMFAAHEFKPIVDPAFFLIAEVHGKPVGFSLAFPDINQALKHLNGRLLPFGWIKFLLAKKKINSYRVLTLGVKKKFRRLGIDVHFYYETYKLFVEKKVNLSEMSWVLEDNQAMVTALHRMGAKLYRTHRIYERACEN